MATEPLFAQFEPSGPLTQVREGAAVYDRSDRKIGTVREVYLGDTTAEERATGQEPATTEVIDDRNDSLLAHVADAFAGPARVPETLRARLLREGYIEIDSSGFFAGDRFATADQIAAVENDRVVLRVDRDELIAAE